MKTNTRAALKWLTRSEQTYILLHAPAALWHMCQVEYRSECCGTYPQRLFYYLLQLVLHLISMLLWTKASAKGIHVNL